MEIDDVVVNFFGLSVFMVILMVESCVGYNNGFVVINNFVGVGFYIVFIFGFVFGLIMEVNMVVVSVNFMNLLDGSYMYSVVGNNGCIYNGIFVIVVGLNCCVVMVVGINFFCNGGVNGIIIVILMGFVLFNYFWIGG